MARPVLTAVVGFVHDLAAGAWAATVLGVWWLDSRVVHAEARAVLDGLERQLFWIGVACVALVVATGAGRGFTYIDNYYGADAERARRRALIVKHIVLLAVFGAGVAWQYVLVFR